MTTRLDQPTTTTDPVVRAILAVTLAITLVGVTALVRAATGDRVHHVPAVRVENQAALPLQVDALDAKGGRIGLGLAKPGTLSTFSEVPDVGPTWTLVATYGGEEVHRETAARTTLAARDWTLTIPADATATLERAGFQ
jgi:hypothetical protein